jgi:hypothetical protein
MPPAIQQHVEFSASPSALFELYLNSRKHAAATGAPAKLSRKMGGAWQAYGGMIGGRNLLIVPATDRTILAREILEKRRCFHPRLEIRQDAEWCRCRSSACGGAFLRPKGRERRVAEVTTGSPGKGISQARKAKSKSR